MALDPQAQAALALHRFGLGPRAGSIAAMASDPRGALLAELDRPDAGRITDPELLNAGEAARAAFDYRRERRAARLVNKEAEAAGGTGVAAPEPNANERMEAAADSSAPKPGA
jgi:uncharacterized protein (DUF1800 family)